MSQNKIIWLDANSSDPVSSFRSKLGDAQTFTRADNCIQYVQSHSNESIYLIVSGSLAKEVVPEIYECSNLVQIYLFCGSIAAYAEWGMNYCDKLMIFNHEDDVLERLWNDLHKNLRDQAMLLSKRAEEYKQRVLEYRQPCG
ncbi:unnamed protein product [Rotaria socialis]|uniref:Uncharacterized protein n=1 Tax=Rotaria socialis TaxID=392032 RepID=A0A817WVJ8_9BILA|nr:unnamed protein product [Rotaria socialis]CAF3359871.1 unnamed protein product [Rotaria socialis]CAF3424685.1 unnamed protein product [Rotaria socialis]CAF3444943.1 unnamed protein product [Rotaria socialis]CAF3640085.1 unnamed protein product [Rotaria socialis]